MSGLAAFVQAVQSPAAGQTVVDSEVTKEASLWPYRSESSLWPPPAEQCRGVFLPSRDDRNFSGCVWLRICGNSAPFFTLLHRQVLDLLD